MDWMRVDIYTSHQGIEPLVGRLACIGISGVEIADEQDFNEFLDSHGQYWDYIEEGLRESMKGETRVTAYTEDNPAGLELLAAINAETAALKASDARNEFGELRVSVSGVKEQDWANNWKKYFKPIKVGKRVLIRPEWDDSPAEAGSTVFTVNPGMTFGTGSHETTRMCIRAIEETIDGMRGGIRMLDIGCGSGILSIIALLLGVDTVTAVDIDANCAEVFRDNAALNCIDPARYSVFTGDILTDGALKLTLSHGEPSFDIVAANVTADVIIKLAPEIKGYLRPGGVFIVSGIIDFRGDEVLQALEDSGLSAANVWREGEWIAVISS